MLTINLSNGNIIVWDLKNKGETKDAKNNKGWKPCGSTHTHTHTHTINLVKVNRKVNIIKGNIGLSGKYYDTG